MRVKTKIKFINFLRPETSYWPYPYTLEQAFCVFQWLIKTGGKYQKWGHSGVYELLSLKPTCINSIKVDPLQSIEDLRLRFHYALLAVANSNVKRWREDLGIIDINKERWIRFPYYPEIDISQILNNFFSLKGKLLVQLNPYHKKATLINHTDIQVYPDEFEFGLCYGYDGSSWRHVLDSSKKGECFRDTLIRVMEKINRMVDIKR
jgi:hypothetical protein